MIQFWNDLCQIFDNNYILMAITFLVFLELLVFIGVELYYKFKKYS